MKMKNSILSVYTLFIILYAFSFSACKKTEEAPIIISQDIVFAVKDPKTGAIIRKAAVEAQIDSKGYKGYNVYLDYKISGSEKFETRSMARKYSAAIADLFVFSVDISPLALGVSYEYRIRIVTQEEEISGELKTFETVNTIPILHNHQLSIVNADGSVSIRVDVDKRGYDPKGFDVYLYYGIGKNFAQNIQKTILKDSAGAYQAVLKELDAEQEYHYFVQIETGIYKPVNSDTNRFTSGKIPTILSKDILSNATDGSLTIEVKTEDNGCGKYEVYIDYGLKGRERDTDSSLLLRNEGGIFKRQLEKLLTDTSYIYKIRLKTVSYKETSFDSSFQTQSSPAILSQKITLNDLEGIVALNIKIDPRSYPNDYKVYIDYGTDKLDSGITAKPLTTEENTFSAQFQNMLLNTVYTYQIRIVTPSYVKTSQSYSFKTGDILKIVDTISTFCNNQSANLQADIFSNGFEQYTVSCRIEKNEVPIFKNEEGKYEAEFTGLKDTAYTYTIYATTPSYKLSESGHFTPGKKASIKSLVFTPSNDTTTLSVKATVEIGRDKKESDALNCKDYSLYLDYDTEYGKDSTLGNTIRLAPDSESETTLPDLKPSSKYFYRLRLVRNNYKDVIKEGSFNSLD